MFILLNQLSLRFLQRDPGTKARQHSKPDTSAESWDRAFVPALPLPSAGSALVRPSSLSILCFFTHKMGI